MSTEVWAAILSAIPNVEVWNTNLPELKRLAEQYGNDFRKFAQEEAVRRGYQWDRAQKRYIQR